MCDMSRRYWDVYKRQKQLGVWVEQMIRDGDMEDPGELLYVRRNQDGNWRECVNTRGVSLGLCRIMPRTAYDEMIQEYGASSPDPSDSEPSDAEPSEPSSTDPSLSSSSSAQGAGVCLPRDLPAPGQLPGP